jgi:hypothetical protein
MNIRFLRELHDGNFSLRHKVKSTDVCPPGAVVSAPSHVQPSCLPSDMIPNFWQEYCHVLTGPEWQWTTAIFLSEAHQIRRNPQKLMSSPSCFSCAVSSFCSERACARKIHLARGISHRSFLSFEWSTDIAYAGFWCCRSSIRFGFHLAAINFMTWPPKRDRGYLIPVATLNILVSRLLPSESPSPIFAFIVHEQCAPNSNSGTRSTNFVLSYPHIRYLATPASMLIFSILNSVKKVKIETQARALVSTAATHEKVI